MSSCPNILTSSYCQGDLWTWGEPDGGKLGLSGGEGGLTDSPRWPEYLHLNLQGDQSHHGDDITILFSDMSLFVIFQGNQSHHPKKLDRSPCCCTRSFIIFFQEISCWSFSLALHGLPMLSCYLLVFVKCNIFRLLMFSLYPFYRFLPCIAFVSFSVASSIVLWLCPPQTRSPSWEGRRCCLWWKPHSGSHPIRWQPKDLLAPAESPESP